MNYIFDNQWKLILKDEKMINIKWYTTINTNLTDIENEKLEKWCLYIKWIITETPEYLTYISTKKAEAIKKQKKSDIDKLATLSDQLNLLAVNLNLVLDEQIKTNPTLATNPNVVQGKKILSWIQTILSK